MEEEKKLYPFRFCTLQDDYPWGSEEFRLADLGYRDSLVREGWLAGNSIAEVMDTYLDRVVGEAAYDAYGRQFPVCVRLLHVRGRMPLRVHPDDETAAQRYDFLGKEKLWYVLRAGKDARLMAGFRRDADAGEFYAKCLDGSWWTRWISSTTAVSKPPLRRASCSVMRRNCAWSASGSPPRSRSRTPKAPPSACTAAWRAPPPCS